MSLSNRRSPSDDDSLRLVELARSRGPSAHAEALAGLRENSERSMRQILGLPPEAARMFQSMFGANAFAAAKACVLIAGREAFTNKSAVGLDYALWTALSNLDDMGGFLRNDSEHASVETADMAHDLTVALGRYGLARQITGSVKSVQDLERVLSVYHDKAESAAAKGVLQLPGGWNWVDLGYAKCPRLEKDRMGHCGYDDRGHIYSLRDRSGNPHVNLTMDPNTKMVYQVSGKGNATPDRRFWPMIRDFIRHFDADLHLPKMGSRQADGISQELDSFIYDEGLVREAGRQNSTAMVVLPGGPPGRNTCNLVRSLSKNRSRLIVVVRPDGIPPGSYERMLRASLPDCERRIRVMEADGSLVDMIISAERNRHYVKKQALEVFCDSQTAQGYDPSANVGLDFDPTLIAVRPISIPRDDANDITKAVRTGDTASQHRVLDPHLFSNPEGLAHYRSALLGESVLREFLTDIAPSRELAIELIHGIIARELRDTTGVQYLGSGRNGSAYRHPDGFIIKITTDPREVSSAERLIGLETEHLGRVYSCRPIVEGIWILTQEELDPLPEHARRRFDATITEIENSGGIDMLNEGRVLDCLECLDSSSIPGVTRTIRQFGVIGMCRELRALGLSGDFHSGNVMLRGDRPVLIDLGTPGDPDAHENKKLPLGRNLTRISEFGSGSPGSGATGPAMMRGSNSSSWSNGRGALKSPMNFVPEDGEADEADHALDWGPGRVRGASF